MIFGSPDLGVATGPCETTPFSVEAHKRDGRLTLKCSTDIQLNLRSLDRSLVLLSSVTCTEKTFSFHSCSFEQQDPEDKVLSTDSGQSETHWTVLWSGNRRASGKSMWASSRILSSMNATVSLETFVVSPTRSSRLSQKPISPRLAAEREKERERKERERRRRSLLASPTVGLIDRVSLLQDKRKDKSSPLGIQCLFPPA